MITTDITDLLKITVPIIQAPMAGGTASTALVAETSNNGALGMVGAGYMSPEELRKQISEIKGKTGKPFGVNLFVPAPFIVSDKEVKVAAKMLEPALEKLGINHGLIPKIQTEEELVQAFREKAKVLVEEKVQICSFTFGIPPKEIIHDLKRHGIILVGTATTVSEAKMIEAAGMDLVVAQGYEAGGHMGGFLNGDTYSSIGLMALVPQVANAVKIPVIAAGGIMDGRGMAASLSLGAKAVQMGSAFLTTFESGAHSLHKEALVKANAEDTVFTRAFSGKWARGIKNQFIVEMREFESFLPEFPVQNTLTKKMRVEAGVQNESGYMALWSGQGTGLARNQSVKELIARTVEEAREIIQRLGG